MTCNQLIVYLELHPDMATCPSCRGAGEIPLPVRGKVIECNRCGGAGVVDKAELERQGW